MLFISNVTLGYGNSNYISLCKVLLGSGIVKNIEFIEPIDYERAYYDLGIDGFSRKERYLRLGNYIRSKVNNKFLRKAIIKFINMIVFNTLVCQKVLSHRGPVVSAKYNPLLGYLPKNSKLTFYASEIFELESRGGYLFSTFANRVNAYISAQEDRLTITGNIFKLGKGYLVENCPYYTERTLNENKMSTLLYQGRLGESSNAMGIIELAKSLPDEIEFHIAGPIDDKYKREIAALELDGIIKYHGYLKAEELRELRNEMSFGLVSWDNNTVNTKYCAPNKLYEYLQSGMVVVSFDNYSMHKLNGNYNFGYVASGENEVTDLTKYLSNLSLLAFKNQSLHNFMLYKSKLNYNSQISKYVDEELK